MIHTCSVNILFNDILRIFCIFPYFQVTLRIRNVILKRDMMKSKDILIAITLAFFHPIPLPSPLICTYPVFHHIRLLKCHLFLVEKDSIHIQSHHIKTSNKVLSVLKEARGLVMCRATKVKSGKEWNVKNIKWSCEFLVFNLWIQMLLEIVISSFRNISLWLKIFCTDHFVIWIKDYFEYQVVTLSHQANLPLGIV